MARQYAAASDKRPIGAGLTLNTPAAAVKVAQVFSVNYFGLLATIILAGSGATWTGVESMVMA